MRLITKNTDYAIRALGFMAASGNGVHSVSDLSRELKIPRPFLRKILQILNKKGILRSQKGKGGGFVLGRPADNIYLMELVKIFQGPVELSRCIIRRGICPDVRTCMLKRKLESIEQNVIKELKSITLASLMEDV